MTVTRFEETGPQETQKIIENVTPSNTQHSNNNNSICVGVGGFFYLLVVGFLGVCLLFPEQPREELI